MLGGGMRQAGVLAAAGWYALDHHVDRLVEDHARARSMAEAMVKHGSFDLDLEAVQTNMVYFAVQGWTAEQTQGHFANAGIDVLTIDDTRCRLVTHLHITDGAVARVEAAVSTVP
jgi:threonine aldolase